MALAVMVSTTEDYCQHAISELVEHGIGSNATGNLLWDDVVQTRFTTWEGQLRLWKAFGVDAARSTEWKSFEPFTHVRNAAVHGLGELTRVQQRSQSALAGIKASGVTVTGKRLDIDLAALRRCRSSAADFIRYLDRQLCDLLARP